MTQIPGVSQGKPGVREAPGEPRARESHACSGLMSLVPSDLLLGREMPPWKSFRCC